MEERKGNLPCSPWNVCASKLRFFLKIRFWVIQHSLQENVKNPSRNKLQFHVLAESSYDDLWYTLNQFVMITVRVVLFLLKSNGLWYIGGQIRSSWRFLLVKVFEIGKKWLGVKLRYKKREDSKMYWIKFKYSILEHLIYQSFI